MAITIKSALAQESAGQSRCSKVLCAPSCSLTEMKQKQIVDQIADRCTLTGSDIKAVLDALMAVIKRNLANGSPFVWAISALSVLPFPVKASRMPVSVGASTVKKARVIYVPSAEIKEAVQAVFFLQGRSKRSDEDGEGGDEKPNPKPDEGGEKLPTRQLNYPRFAHRKPTRKIPDE